MEERINRVITLLGLDAPPDAALIEELLRQGERLALSYTGRASLPSDMDSCLVRLAAVLFNRLGAEGESARREGEVSVRMETLPEDIRVMLRPFRLGKAVG